MLESVGFVFYSFRSCIIIIYLAVFDFGELGFVLEVGVSVLGVGLGFETLVGCAGLGFCHALAW